MLPYKSSISILAFSTALLISVCAYLFLPLIQKTTSQPPTPLQPPSLLPPPSRPIIFTRERITYADPSRENLADQVKNMVRKRDLRGLDLLGSTLTDKKEWIRDGGWKKFS